ncbi:MAG: hypothetical protein IPK16_09085 [Anaerolineales bacterium]|nr:hypothetical protein [Anaerolineales bacterium]
MTSQIDSRVILDTPGAEALLGRGDMLLMRPDMGKLTRLQGCFVSDEEINRIVDFWKQQAAAQPATSLPPWNSMMDRLGDDEELIQDATDVKSVGSSAPILAPVVAAPFASKPMTKTRSLTTPTPDPFTASAAVNFSVFAA